MNEELSVCRVNGVMRLFSGRKKKKTRISRHTAKPSHINKKTPPVPPTSLFMHNPLYKHAQKNTSIVYNLTQAPHNTFAPNLTKNSSPSYDSLPLSPSGLLVALRLIYIQGKKFLNIVTKNKNTQIELTSAHTLSVVWELVAPVWPLFNRQVLLWETGPHGERNKQHKQ